MSSSFFLDLQRLNLSGEVWERWERKREIERNEKNPWKPSSISVSSILESSRKEKELKKYPDKLLTSQQTRGQKLKNPLGRISKSV